MIKKISASPEGTISEISSDKILASPELVERMSKVASDIRSIAPRSDDFTYFSIVFLKSAEAALLDDYGNIKKTASGEDAWGFFDENWKWHGNVQPLKNNNGDIFPESELKKAAKDWIGKPLCRDHESSSVDGIRGIILDTHYDDKFKQVVGLCALDKVNYPDLSSKVKSGLVRYGSMGTAVEEAICTTCQKRAKVQSDYCEHIKAGTNYGEINVGLKPIEYSLVVQPAERGAVLLKVFASLKNYQDEFINNGVANVDEMLGKLSLQQAQHLDGIMKTACGDDGCSIDKRSKIVRSFLENNNLVKKAANETEVSGIDLASARNAVDIASAVEKLDTTNNPAVRQLISKALQLSGVPDPSLASGTLVSGESSGLMTGDASNQILLSGDSGPSPDFQDENVAGVSVPAPGVAENSTAFAGSKKTENLRKLSINKIMEDIMNESKLRNRAELRRRVAYHQGGSEGVEPNTFKAESFGFDHDKQMHQDGSMGGADGMHPGDADRKEKLSRAELEARRIRRNAYHQGGSEGREPSTFKAESFGFDHDKQMHQDGGMGGADGMHPGDADRKEKLSRARDQRSLSKRGGFSGPTLRTRMAIKRDRFGALNKSASVFEVLSGDKTLIRATAGEIFGSELEDNWSWVTSPEYGKEVCRQVRASGVGHVRGLLKGAQDAAAGEDLLGGMGDDLGLGGDTADAGAPAEGAPAEAPAAGGEELDLGLGDAPEGEGDDAPEEEGTPSQEIDARLADMEALIDEIRDLTDRLEDEKVADIDVNINSGAGAGEQVSSETIALAGEIVDQLKVATAKLDESADEISMVAETYDNIGKLSNAQKSHFVKLASAAIKDSDEVSGEARALIRVANSLVVRASDLLDDVRYDEADTEEADTDKYDCADTGDCADPAHSHELVSEAMNLRRARREAILKQAQERTLGERRAAREALLNKAAEDMAHTDMAHTDMAHTDMAHTDMAYTDMADSTSCADTDEDKAHTDMADSTSCADTDEDKAHTDMADSTSCAETGEGKTASRGPANDLREKLRITMEEKRAEEDRNSYKIMLRRAYDVGLEMQRKGLLPTTKTALDRQVDEIMSFDNNAFEAFKRSIEAARSVGSVKVASDLGGINVGVSSDATEKPAEVALNASSLSSMWE